MDKTSILISLDNVICFPKYLDTINEFMNTNYVIDNFKEYYMDSEVVPDNRYQEFITYLNNKNLYENATLLPNAKEVLEKLNFFYELYIYTSYVNKINNRLSPKEFKNKYDYLLSTLTFIEPEKFVFIENSEILHGDALIDDRISCLKSNGNTKYKILFPAYHNKKIPNTYIEQLNIIRAGYNWQEGWETIGKMFLPDEQKKYTFKR